MHRVTGGNIREVLRVSIPLILASTGHALSLFVDRAMLANYSQEAVSASFPAGLTSFTLDCFFFGVTSYTNVFVAQYYGAKNFKRVGTAVWQGIFIGLVGGLLLSTGYFWAKPLFASFGHDPKVQELEVIYFQILSLGAAFPLLTNALSAFWSGRGRTVIIMFTNFLVTFLNILFNYLLIFGKTINLGRGYCISFPEMGIAGAAWGTVLSGGAGTLFLACIFFLSKINRKTYGSCEHVFDWSLLKRILYYGSPNGIQLFLDVAAFNVFAILLGLISVPVQEAASIVFALNSLSFQPMIGLGQTASVLVGQAIGARNIKLAKQSIRSTRFLVILYSCFMLFIFLVYPDNILSLFARKNDIAQIEAMEYARKFLYFITAYILFDGIGVIYAAAIKGAGDTKFVMITHIVVAWGCFAIPSIIYKYLGGSVWGLWTISLFYIILLAIFFYLRYRGGAWKTMCIIEEQHKT